MILLVILKYSLIFLMILLVVLYFVNLYKIKKKGIVTEDNFLDKYEEQKPKEERFKLSYRYQVHGEVFFQGRKLAEITDVGFNNVDEVIAKLVEQLPDDIPNRSMVIFKIENQDKKQSVVYERMKGKGF